MKCLSKHIVLLIASACFLANSCTKTKLGTYTLTIDGISYSVERNAFCCDTTGIYSQENYHAERDVKITHVGNSTVEMSGDIWTKKGDSLIFKSGYDSRNDPTSGLGGWWAWNQSYRGIMLSNKVIKGNYSNTYSFVNGGSKLGKSLIQATFTLKRN